MKRDFMKCKYCQEWGWTDTHTCDPTWLVIYFEHDEEDEPSRVHATDAENAALKYAEKNFSNWDYPDNLEIWARKTDDDEWEKFDITVEAVPSFSAERKD